MHLRFIGAAALLVAFSWPGLAQTKTAAEAARPPEAAAPANPQPPYLVTDTEHVLILFEADENALKSLLPPGLRPAEGNVAAVNMYRTGPVVGLVPYTGSYLWINVADLDSPDGTKGRWMAQGWYGPELVSSAFKALGFPIQLGTTSLEREGNRVHAVLNTEGGDLIEATITLKDEAPTKASGVLNYPIWGPKITAKGSAAAQNGIVVSRIPYIGEGRPAEPMSLSLHLRDKDPARVLQPKRLLGAVYFKATAFALGGFDQGQPENKSASR